MGIGRKKGITIVMLVVTVVLLMILTVAVISSLDQNDMFGETHTTIGNYNKQAMIEEIKIELQKGRLEKLSEGDYNFDLKEDVIPIIETFGTYEEHKLKLTTTETKIPIYLYEVVDVYLGELVKVEFINNELTITEEELKLTENGYKYEYSEDNGVTWKEYTGQTIVSQPEEVKLRLVNTEEEEIAKEEYFNSQEVCYVTKIEIMTEPTKKTYIAGEKFNNAGMVIIATYEDNTTKIIRNYQYSPVQELTTSDKNAVISYTEHGKTVTVLQPITVTNYVERITIATAPRHVTYRQGQMFDKTGMVVKAIYQDGSERQVTNYTVTPNGALTVSDTSVTITYEEEGKTRTAIQNIKVAALDSIAVEITPTKTDYKHGDVFDESGMTITAIYKYADNTTFGLPVTGWSVANPILAYGQESVAITYTEGGITKTTTQNIRVATLDSIAVETAPTKTGYKHGDTFDQTGMTIRATYKYPDNTTFSSIVTGWNVTNPSIIYAEPSVTISYTECGVTKTTTTPITVNRILASIAVTTVPTKTVYKYGETFDKTGMVVQATYTDSTTPVAVTGYTVTNGSNLTLTQTSVTISYTENGVTKQATTPITVNRLLSSIAVATAPTKTEYNHGEAFDKTGMVVQATYTDSTTPVVITTYTVTNGSNLTAAQTSVTISYTENGVTKTTTTPITVKKSVGPTDGTYYADKGVNSPKLADGMIAVYWEGTTEITSDDPSFDYDKWYDYKAQTGTTESGGTSKWANAKTADGSYWVWIPRYAYAITSGYHTSTAGTIEVEFLKGATNESTAGRTSYTNATGQGNWNIHPAFTFTDSSSNTVNLTGIWVSKYMMSRNNSTISSAGSGTTFESKPNKLALTHDLTGDVYTWGINYNTNLKSHLIKSTEWGAVAYLAHSKYGRNGTVVSLSRCTSSITGSGPTAHNSSTTYAYDQTNFLTNYSYTSANGQLASTTGNIYGVYDMSGRNHHTASYINYSSYLTSYAASVKNGLAQYKVVYPSNNGVDNVSIFNSARPIYGDSLYEIASGSYGNYAWFGQYITAAGGSDPIFCKGGSGLFASHWFRPQPGYAYAHFRFVIWCN